MDEVKDGGSHYDYQWDAADRMAVVRWITTRLASVTFVGSFFVNILQLAHWCCRGGDQYDKSKAELF